MLIANYFAQKWFDKKDLAAGRITQADFEAQVTQAAGDKAGRDDAPAFYALFPLAWIMHEAESATQNRPLNFELAAFFAHGKKAIQTPAIENIK